MGIGTLAIIVVAAILIVGAAFGVFFYVDFILAARFPKISLGGRSDAAKAASKTEQERR